MSGLIAAELAWISATQRALDKCPSEGLGFYTIGDRDVTVYDKSKEEQINQFMDSRNCDFCTAVDACNAYIGRLKFPSNVHSTAG